MGLKRLLLFAVVVAVATLALASGASADDFADQPCFEVGGLSTCPAGTTGTPYSLQLQLAEGAGCGPGLTTWTVDSGSFPPGLSLDSGSGRIEGTPTEAGAFRFYVKVSYPIQADPVCNGGFSDHEFMIPIVPGLPKLTLGPEGTVPGTVGTPYSLQMTATVSEPKTWSVSSGALPAGLAIDASTGLISGTPTAAGEFGFTVLAQMNSDSRSDTKALGIVVREQVGITGTEPFTTARRAVTEVSLTFDAMLAATGGTGTYVWSLTSGALPPGLTLADGRISGTPTTGGLYRFTATVTDSESRVANYPATIVVAAKLTVSTLLLRPGKVGKFYAAKVATLGGVKPSTWKILRGPLPRGVRFDRKTGQLFGIPTRPGRFRVTFEATDALGVKATKTLAIVVIAAPKPKKPKTG